MDMKIKSAAVLGAGAVGAYFVYGLTDHKNLDFCVIADGARKERLERDGITIDDRKDAICYALDNAEEGDIIVMLGKGHETYQEIKGVRYHFSEEEVILDYFKNKS